MLNLSLAALLAPALYGAPSAIDLAAEAYAISAAELELIHSAQIEIPALDSPLHRAKLLNRRTGDRYYIDYDGTGRLVDGEMLLRQSRRPTKLAPDVRERLAGLAVGTEACVALWLDAGPVRHQDVSSDELAGLPIESVRQIRHDALAEMRRVSAAAHGRVLPLLESKGARIVYSSPIAPLVYVEVALDQIEAIANAPAIAHVYSGWNESADELDIQACAVNAKPLVWNAGVTGEGVIVAHVEDSRSDPDNTCIHCYVGANKPTHTNIDQHSTACAGMMVSDHATYRGVAYGACYYSANGGTYSDADMSGAIDAAALNADVQSHSWGQSTNGQINVHDRHIDYIVRNSRQFADDSAGNSGNNSYLTSPGNGYNICTVANFDDRGSCDWSGDILSSSSSGKNPPSEHMDREKPEVAGPGTNITSLQLAGSPSCPTGNVGSGTSYSAPIICGIAALAMEADPALVVWPEAMKALMMSGGLHNVEGDRRLSDLDGAGGVDAIGVVSSAYYGRWAARTVTGAAIQNRVVSLGQAQAGQRLKVAVVWDSDPNSGYTTDPVLADIDLDILDPNNNVIGSSSSYDNTYEIVDVDLTLSGEYKARLSHRRFEGTREYLAGAWTLSN